MLQTKVIRYHTHKDEQLVCFFVGADSSGKSTIAKELSKRLKIPYFKNKNEAQCFRTNFMNELHLKGSYLYEILRDTKYSLIKDRDYVCEAAYSQAYGRETDMPFILDLDKKYRALNLHIVFCYKTAHLNFSDHLIKEDMLPKIIQGYRNFKEMSINLWLELDTTDENLEDQISKIRSFLKR